MNILGRLILLIGTVTVCAVPHGLAQEEGLGFNNWVQDMAVGPNGELYAAGGFTEVQGLTVAGVAMWDGETWSDVGKGVWYRDPYDGSEWPSECTTLYADGDDIYAGGNFTHVGVDRIPASNIAVWNGTTWRAIENTPDYFQEGWVYDVEKIGNTLYIAGDFLHGGEESGSFRFSVLAWDGTTFKELGDTSEMRIKKLIPNGNTLYGIATAANGYTEGYGLLHRWTGTSWVLVLNGGPGTTKSVMFRGNDIYFAGLIESITQPAPEGSEEEWETIRVNGITRWSGGRYYPLGNGAVHVDQIVFWNNTLIAGGFNTGVYLPGDSGNFTQEHMVYWTGSQWVAMGSGLQQTTNLGEIAVNAFAATHGLLYVGGVFQEAGGQPVRNIAQWDGKKWAPVGPVVREPVFKVDNEGKVYTQGTYLTSGADFAEHWPVDTTGDSEELEPGDVLALTAGGGVERAAYPGSVAVIGVYAEQPGLLASGPGDASETLVAGNRVPVGMKGIVRVKATAVKHGIEPGDPLTLSSVPGHLEYAQPVTLAGQTFHLEESLVGKALEGLEEGRGVIRILLTQQYKGVQP